MRIKKWNGWKNKNEIQNKLTTTWNTKERERRSELSLRRTVGAWASVPSPEPLFLFIEVSFGLFFVASHRSLCLSSGLEPSSNGGFLAWREDAVAWRLTAWEERLACVSGDSGRWRLSQIRRRRFVFREVEASSASPPPVLVPGKERLSLLRLRRFWAPEGRGSYSSTLSV